MRNQREARWVATGLGIEAKIGQHRAADAKHVVYCCCLEERFANRYEDSKAF